MPTDSPGVIDSISETTGTEDYGGGDSNDAEVTGDNSVQVFLLVEIRQFSLS